MCLEHLTKTADLFPLLLLLPAAMDAASSLPGFLLRSLQGVASAHMRVRLGPRVLADRDKYWDSIAFFWGCSRLDVKDSIS